MFTGLVDDIGVIEQVSVTDAGREFRVRCRYSDLLDGESIALDGACLTVRETGDRWFTAAAVVTTLDRTTIGGWHAGRRVNLERAMRPTDRMGGHIVQGHVDAVGTIRSISKRDDAWIVLVDIPAAIDALLVTHGSITVDGISLTVNDIPEAGVLGLSIIEYTWRHTTLSDRVAGDGVHLESDVIGKFVQRLLHPYVSAAAPSGAPISSPQLSGSVHGLLHSLES
ncbi:MAG: riboflavin synthase [Gemmatimonadaceae bacterium]|nr:riboflavin synthase [Gemmatimonadaceae bacterium]